MANKSENETPQEEGKALAFPLADCRVCGSTFRGKPGEKAPTHNSGSKGQRCPGSNQGMVTHVPK